MLELVVVTTIVRDAGVRGMTTERVSIFVRSVLLEFVGIRYKQMTSDSSPYIPKSLLPFMTLQHYGPRSLVAAAAEH